ncbi:hypothetical protein KSC_059110 [Ktedonobacter sp. SOSP1-52]|uniref:hypothetical protein n=1 Tax=Ktedonobacter sp. SOSP1-52 TaxID=2778366 RepID=UPI0019169472|nr:hypothetical protein [Ktedonobacter sp. SOSP1-52]GHO67019.1 hypothetical protein KSC_059110 [Ktedonobacter sp. SOSP1-52]
MQQYDRNNLPTTDTLRTKSRSQTVITTALLLFAITGLLSGFTFNAMNRPPKSTPPTTNITKQSPVATKTKTPTSSPTTQPIVDVAATSLGCPTANVDQPTQKPDGTTLYTASLQAVTKGSKGANKCQGEVLKAPEITCKLWLTKNPDETNKALTKDSYALLKNLDNLEQPIPNEEQGALVFSSNAQSLQPCHNDGTASWQYQVSTSVQPGTYYLVYVVDWKGKRFNWSYKQVTIA